MKRITFTFFVILISFFSILNSPIIFADGLMIAPTHVVINSNQGRATVKLINNSNKTKRYRVSFVEMTMTEKGEIKRVKSNRTSTIASDKIVFSPRRVKIPPHTSQNIRLQLMTNNLRPGEYRSHLLFKEIPKDTSSSSIKNQVNNEHRSDDKNRLQIQLRPLIGVSIPVILRHGNNRVHAALSEIKLDRDGKKDIVSLKINRSGNSSVYGNIKAYHILNGTKKEVGIIKGISVYTNLTSRKVRFALSNTENINLNKGYLEIVYKQKSGYGGKLIAKEKIKL